jgi:predicted GNAT family acetyltransferase
MNTEKNSFEYPDAAGYPDGVGFLDEGTAGLVSEVAAEAVRNIDRPSTDRDSEIEIHRRDDGITLLATTVVPEFRGRGLASDLIADALDDVRTRGKRVTVYCPVVNAFMTNNQQYSDLSANADS